MLRIEFPWPDAELGDNARVHFQAKARAVKRQRETAFWLAKEAKVQFNPNAKLLIEYHPPNNQRRDAQNMPARLKGLIDGIADAMGCDDNGFRVQYPDTFSAVVRPRGKIVVTIDQQAIREKPQGLGIDGGDG